MHPLLTNFSIFSMNELVNDATTATNFFSDIGIIPKRSNPPICPKCGETMKAFKYGRSGSGFRFLCIQRNKKNCPGYVNSQDNTFLSKSKLSSRDILAIIILFVLKFRVVHAFQHITAWRNRQKEPTMSVETICDWYRNCRSIAIIHCSHFYDEWDESKKPFTEPYAIELYFKKRIDIIKDFGGRIQRFLDDIIEVYPGYKNGIKAEGLRLARLIVGKPKTFRNVNMVCEKSKIKKLKVEKVSKEVKEDLLEKEVSQEVLLEKEVGQKALMEKEVRQVLLEKEVCQEVLMDTQVPQEVLVEKEVSFEDVSFFSDDCFCSTPQTEDIGEPCDLEFTEMVSS